MHMPRNNDGRPKLCCQFVNVIKCPTLCCCFCRGDHLLAGVMAQQNQRRIRVAVSRLNQPPLGGSSIADTTVRDLVGMFVGTRIS
jgi:hypothetical protein